MSTHDEATRVARDERVVTAALEHYRWQGTPRPTLITLSENATYAIADDRADPVAIMRVHREQYHRRHEIESELDWLAALTADGVVGTPQVIRTLEGDRVVTVNLDGVPRYAVLAEVIPGAELDEDDLSPENFARLGAITARLHGHAREWTRPVRFARFSWDVPSGIGPRARWGDWKDGPTIGAPEIALLERTVELLMRRLDEYGTDPDRYGLIHADLRLANLMSDGTHLTVIDFDDCGFSWFLYDFGTAVSFIEDDPRLGEWQAAWTDGYRSVAEMSDTGERMLATFVMFRRMLLLAWMGSHAYSIEVREKGADFAAGTCRLAEAYLTSNGASLAMATGV